MKFSVLMSVYYKENPIYLEEALSSIENQTLLASEIVLVKDGPLDRELNALIDRHQKNSCVPYMIISLEKNEGLGVALDKGLEVCQYPWVARMDGDDIATPDRFAKQIVYLEAHPDVDALGSWITEFNDNPENSIGERRPPCEYTEILEYAKYRNPLNHMTVMFRKTAVESAGGYLSMNGFEDYYLWVRMLKKGKQFANIPEVLLKARTGRSMIRRRQGWQYAKDELIFEKAVYKIGFWSEWDLFRNFFIRILPRLLPLVIVEKLYNFLRK